MLINREKVLCCLLMLGLASLASPASAEQRLYHETPGGWFIYIEDRSCVAYIDYEHGAEQELMMRFSAREDENRMHFSIVSHAWEMLTPLIGKQAMLFLEFADTEQNFGANSIVLRAPDGRMGLGANAFGIEEVIRQLATNETLRVQAKVENGPMTPIAEVGLRDAAVAMMHLGQCGEDNPA